MSTQLALREAALNLCERAVHDGVNRRFWPRTADLARSLTPSKLSLQLALWVAELEVHRPYTPRLASSSLDI